MTPAVVRGHRNLQWGNPATPQPWVSSGVAGEGLDESNALSSFLRSLSFSLEIG